MTNFLRLSAYTAIGFCCLAIALSFATARDANESGKAVQHLQNSFVLAIVAGVLSAATDTSKRR